MKITHDTEYSIQLLRRVIADIINDHRVDNKVHRIRGALTGCFCQAVNLGDQTATCGDCPKDYKN